MERSLFVAGNWKMYKNIAQAEEFAEQFKQIYKPVDGVDVAICAPFLQLETLKNAFADTNVGVGAQNMHYQTEGAYTGEISGEMLTELGIDYVIIGHSERRAMFNETDETVNLKIKQALVYSLKPIICVALAILMIVGTTVTGQIIRLMDLNATVIRSTSMTINVTAIMAGYARLAYSA